MNKVLNEYIDNGDGTTLLRISGKMYSPQACLIDTAHVSEVRKYSWCYEQTKAEIYTMDTSGALTAKFNFKTPRVYLWRFICYLHTNNPKLVIRRPQQHDYTVAANLS